MGAAAAIAASTQGGGLYGVIRLGPTRPVCQVGIPCDAPAQVTLAFRRAGRIVAHVRSNEAGRYRIALPPGIYSVSPAPPVRIGRGIVPRNVHVRASHFDRLDFFI